MAASATNNRSATAGLAPHGMLWVAWRQRRSLILITLGLYAAVAATIIVRSMLRARDLASAGVTDLAACSDPGMTATVLASCERWFAARSDWSSMDSQVSNAAAVICVLFGLGLGAAVIGHELERGLGAFSFTQSISPIRWATTQFVVVAGSSVVGVVILDVLVRMLVDERSPIDGPGRTSQWQQPLLLAGTICFGFLLSIVSRSAAGGFWSGLGVFVLGGIALNFLSRSTATSRSDKVLCPRAVDELCDRTTPVVFQFRALTGDTTSTTVQLGLITLVAGAVVALVVGFLLLRRRFR